METIGKLAGQESRSDETRLRIFEKTLGLVESEGVASLTVRKIASASHVSPALIIQYFNSKDRLLFRVFEHVNADLDERVLALKQTVKNGNAAGACRQLMALLLGCAFQQKDLLRYIMSYSYTWDTEQELAFRTWVEPLRRAVGAVLQVAVPDLTDDEAFHYSHLIYINFAQVFRIAVSSGWSDAEALEHFEPTFRVLGQGLVHRNA